MRSWEVRTLSGSLYRVAVDAQGRWWVSGDNIPSCSSSSLADGCWEIQPPSPWPPALGMPLRFVAPSHLFPGDAERVPGGGKVTSAVVAVAPAETPATLRVPLGFLVATPAALERADRGGFDLAALVERHQHGDWGEAEADNAAANLEALRRGHGTVLSVYGDREVRIWISTSIAGAETSTCIMLPEEW
jgi:hypothetical protein